MGAIKKLIYRRFSKDEYKQLRGILKEETKVMLRRPGYIIGHILILGMLFYFLVRAFGPENLYSFKRPEAGAVLGTIIGVAIGTFIYWLLLKISTAKGSNLKFAVAFWGVWMFLFFLLTLGQPDSGAGVNWEFVIYAAMMFFGWLFCTASIKEHFCEKIFMFQKEGGQAD